MGEVFCGNRAIGNWERRFLVSSDLLEDLSNAIVVWNAVGNRARFQLELGNELIEQWVREVVDGVTIDVIDQSVGQRRVEGIPLVTSVFADWRETV